MDPLLGAHLGGKYRVLRQLGSGGMGVVYEGEHTLIKKRVAIKVLHAQLALQGEVVARFIREAQAATSIGNPHIIEVTDMGRTEEGAYYMAMELLEGRDFSSLLETTPPPTIRVVVHVIRQVCAGLHAAHQKGIVHRDVKPENVFVVTRPGEPLFAKVLDFGISKMDDALGSQTRSNLVLGTAYYMSPEQAQGARDVDARTDVWAVGVMLFKALTGHFPFEGTNFPMLIVSICSTDAPSALTLRPDLPVGLADIIARCLRRPRDQRIGSCAELATLLSPFEGVEGSSAASAELALAPTQATPQPRQQLPLTASPGADAERAPSSPGERSRGSVGQATSSPPHELRARWLSVTAVLGAALLLTLGALAMSAAPGSEPRASTAPWAQAAATEREDSVAQASETDAHALAPESSVEILVSPVDAVALVDGRRIEPTSDGALRVAVREEDMSEHELRLEARGFRTRIESIRLSYPQRVIVDLDPGTGQDDRRVVAPPVAVDPPPVRGRRGPVRVRTPTGGPSPPPLLTEEAPK